MRLFQRELAARQSDPADRRWIVAPYDQLTDRVGPLSREDPRALGIVVVESPWKARRRPYHQQKLAFVVANLRQFALEQAARGVAVRHVVAPGPYRDALRPVLAELGGARIMRPAERELRVDLAPLVDDGLLQVVPHDGWLTTPDEFLASQGTGPWRMDAFYRHVRRARGILMEAGRPLGGQWSHDADNRQPWPGTPPEPAPLRFQPDAVTREVGDLIRRAFRDHPGTLDLETLPATQADADAHWAWARAQCLPHFGPFEDAMAVAARTLFHTRVSALVNVMRLLPQALIDDALALGLPLASIEGFVRQLLGWREYMRHIHEATDGFRQGPGLASPLAARPGDGGYQGWTGRAWPGSDPLERSGDGGAAPSFLGADRPVPPAFWNASSGLACLDQVVRSVWEDAYSHHITRLMILSNLAQLLDVSPRDLTDWFWVAYVDAYDWVVEPNVLAMSTFGIGPVATTKPYVSGAAYIDRMSDYCPRCQFDPRTTCPITPLYWAYLARHREKLATVPRLNQVLSGLARRPAARQAADAAVFADVSRALAAGERLSALPVDARRPRSGRG